VNDAAAPLASSEVAERARALGRAAGEEVERARAERTAERARLRASLLDAQERRAWRQAGAALIDLLALDAEGLADAPLREAAVAIAVHLAFEEAPEADRLFAALGQDSGSAGLDVLYDLVSGKGGSIAAERAERLLAEPEVRARSGAALRIALEMRAARCSDKPALFARAAREGDARVLLYLERLRSARCDPRIGECCFHGSRALRRATEALDERLARSAAR
jgi:serine/threonine-protein kinase